MQQACLQLAMAQLMAPFGTPLEKCKAIKWQ